MEGSSNLGTGTLTGGGHRGSSLEPRVLQRGDGPRTRRSHPRWGDGPRTSWPHLARSRCPGWTMEGISKWGKGREEG